MNSSRLYFESDYEVEQELTLHKLSFRLFWVFLVCVFFCLVMIGAGYFFEIYNEQVISTFTFLLLASTFLLMIITAIYLITDNTISKIVNIRFDTNELVINKKYKDKERSIPFDSIHSLKFRKLMMSYKKHSVRFVNYRIKIKYKQNGKRKKFKQDLIYTAKEETKQLTILDQIEQRSGIKKEKLWSPQWFSLVIG